MAERVENGVLVGELFVRQQHEAARNVRANDIAEEQRPDRFEVKRHLALGLAATDREDLHDLAQLGWKAGSVLVPVVHTATIALDPRALVRRRVHLRGKGVPNSIGGAPVVGVREDDPACALVLPDKRALCLIERERIEQNVPAGIDKIRRDASAMHGWPKTIARSGKMSIDCSGPQAWIDAYKKQFKIVGNKVIDRGTVKRLQLCSSEFTGAHSATVDVPAGYTMVTAVPNGIPRFAKNNMAEYGKRMQPCETREPINDELTGPCRAICPTPPS